VKRVAFCTFGCRLNQYDTESIRTLLERDGAWRKVGQGEAADVVVVNTCTVTARADATARKAIRRIHAEQPEARIVVTGCYAQRAPGELAELPGVSLVVGAADRTLIPAKLDGLEPGPPEIAVSPIGEAKAFLDVPITEMMEHSRAFVKVQEGCNESCSFCIVPQTRGRSRSRPFESVIRQVEELIGAGHVEIVLTGVHVGDYGLDLPGGQRRLAALIERVLEVPGLARFRLSSIEPSSLTDELVELAASAPKFARHFHIPFQSGSDTVLSKMRRRYTSGRFASLVERIVERVPGCAIGADVICGFPGETQEDFQRTFDSLEALPVTHLHAFAYSVRPGSAAESLGDPVAGDEKKRRVRALKRLVREKHTAFRRRHLHAIVAILPEPERRGGEQRVAGWTDDYLRVDLGPGDAVETGLVDVRVTGLSDDGLVGVRAARL
jgi:threonylcarbamoyladenosine tRNA methylthiotransferase MtaB